MQITDSVEGSNTSKLQCFRTSTLDGLHDFVEWFVRNDKEQADTVLYVLCGSSWCKQSTPLKGLGKCRLCQRTPFSFGCCTPVEGDDRVDTSTWTWEPVSTTWRCHSRFKADYATTKLKSTGPNLVRDYMKYDLQCWASTTPRVHAASHISNTTIHSFFDITELATASEGTKQCQHGPWVQAASVQGCRPWLPEVQSWLAVVVCTHQFIRFLLNSHH
ncbi:hypothetical protein SCLCIDRAFT_661286 [Scleroderma citrinum Foug A]|uniref:Uncharacterized protein n=1 Tax=Scleroderma citrinum Foug A TaxID=1036808 RepID=A0A0C3DU77_9AGAM|nr:hypothetical protein SCLCIDRAFT_661286 [Scleroderma citrinum Foug A]